MTTSDQNCKTLKLSNDKSPTFLIFNWVGFTFLCCHSFKFMLDHYIITWQSWLGALRRLMMRNFWFTINIQVKGPFSHYFQFTCILTEWMRLRTLFYSGLFPDKEAEPTSHRKAFCLIFSLKIHFPLKNNWLGKKNKINKIRPTLKKCIFSVLQTHFIVHIVGGFWGSRARAARNVAQAAAACAESIGFFPIFHLQSASNLSAHEAGDLHGYQWGHYFNTKDFH